MNMSSELLKQVRVLDPMDGRDQVADVLIIDGYITAIESQIYDYPEHTQIIDCHGMILGPGLVDMYSHTGEPGFEERETIASLEAAARAGGYTRLGILPDMLPPADNLSTIQHWQGLAPHGFYVWGAATRGAAGEMMTEFAELATTNIIGFADGYAHRNLNLWRRVLEYVNPLKKTIALYCCDRTLADSGVMREGYASIYSGLTGIPDYAETVAISAVLELVAAIGTPVHIMRVSTARGVQLIREAKQRHLPITASTTWMHLLFDTEAITGRLSDCGLGWAPNPYDPNLNVDPPLGNPDDRQALIQAIVDGTIDAIAVDHTPYTYEEKTVAFADAPPGAIGLELALSLLWKTFVQQPDTVFNIQWSPLQLWRVLSTQPAHCLAISPPTVTVNRAAELTLFDPAQPWRVDHTTIKSRSANTPCWGQEMTGKVMKTWRG